MTRSCWQPPYVPGKCVPQCTASVGEWRDVSLKRAAGARKRFWEELTAQKEAVTAEAAWDAHASRVQRRAADARTPALDPADLTKFDGTSER